LSDLFTRLVRNSIKPDDQNENGCWLWTGTLNNANYGRFPYRLTLPNGLKKVRHKSAHRSMEQEVRDQAAQLDADMAAEDWLLAAVTAADALDPDTETIEHLCVCRRCINPDHWIVVTRAENTALMQQRRKK